MAILKRRVPLVTKKHTEGHLRRHLQMFRTFRSYLINTLVLIAKKM